MANPRAIFELIFSFQIGDARGAPAIVIISAKIVARTLDGAADRDTAFLSANRSRVLTRVKQI